MSKLTSKQKRALRSNMTGYAFILPNLIGYSIFVFVPVIFSFVLSVMSWDGSQRPMQFVGLQNFTEIPRCTGAYPVLCADDSSSHAGSGTFAGSSSEQQNQRRVIFQNCILLPIYCFYRSGRCCMEYAVPA